MAGHINSKLGNTFKISIRIMSKADFISSSIFEFDLPHNFGFAYCKVLDFRHLREFDGVLVNVFDYIVQNPISDITILGDKDLLFGTRRMPWLPGTRGKGAWKFKGVLVSQIDNIIPDFKYSIKEHLIYDDESHAGPWYAIRNLVEQSPFPYPHECISHLEDTVVSSQNGIEIRTAMEYCRVNNIDIKSYFDYSKTINTITFRQMKNIPIYKTIPIRIRGKVNEI
jgi:hypothetical protein